MEQFSHHAALASPGATDTFATCLGARLLPGDVILLEGPIGAGKTHFARALIQSILTVPEDVPSPTFTLVQTYDTTRGEVWHTDLYRLLHPDDIEELGLPEAMTDAICLIEWPDRLGSLRPDGALSLDFATTEAEDARTLTLTWQHDKWNERLMGCLP
ncbi:MAG: tRNA (adenosine(37)-N6)-threonylcarbamoyltransferase complex ATPase subunit type 1 TsaE [Sediminimonas qiaohouensis]|uniref:tRNA threonylcarbamoyladenosine biosynthesis protein TsaE n=1 Tax=Sediminimonas qiaohouensis TaxID=552061 RepID=A0A7C9HJ24_9RHOB|nr:tRNA (adenosine(37)-N6)-threonylcarbamoyltransferase complex ATPase subunit type 1 TsaE [Sediminimonas qiaohouensis]MTJ04632.1 tRNA (adenosine(37)-N6)-threonylcarbamoyltransferase complex ATPase subunit type 1 TsaE [Sediminimonas qiaohouensis]